MFHWGLCTLFPDQASQPESDGPSELSLNTEKTFNDFLQKPRHERRQLMGGWSQRLFLVNALQDSGELIC